MVKTTLLDADLALGSRMVEWLDQADLAIKVAAWLYLEDYEEWRFALASPRLDATGGAAAYGLVNDALKAVGLPVAKTPTILIFGMKEPFIRALRALFAKTWRRRGSAVRELAIVTSKTAFCIASASDGLRH
jgi:hypothetical protein